MSDSVMTKFIAVAQSHRLQLLMGYMNGGADMQNVLVSDGDH